MGRWRWTRGRVTVYAAGTTTEIPSIRGELVNGELQVAADSPIDEHDGRTDRRYGGLRASSDRIADLDQWGLYVTCELLGSPPQPEPFGERVV